MIEDVKMIDDEEIRRYIRRISELGLESLERLSYNHAHIKDILSQTKTKRNEEEKMQIKVKYHNKNIEKLHKISAGDWVDLRAAETVSLNAMDSAYISLGISVKLPDGYEAHIAPRSSTFKNFGIIQSNSVGVVDNSYSGDNDVWKFPVIALRKTTINEGDRICQFRIIKKMDDVEFVEVDNMEDEDRGGFGSTGIL